jgi:hypothetical protein
LRYSISRQIRRQWVVDAHRAGTLTLAALLLRQRGSSSAANLRLVIVGYGQ